VLAAKRLLDTDFWIEWSAPTPAKRQADDLARLVAGTIGDPDLLLPEVQLYFRQSSLANFVGELLQPAYAKRFLDRSEAEIDRILQSFRLENCQVHHDLPGDPNCLAQPVAHKEGASCATQVRWEHVPDE
jgi:hypothetical protein